MPNADIVLQNIKSRRSVRSYLNKKISQAIIDEIFEAVRWAPSAVNRQPWKFIVITDSDIRKKLATSPFSRHILSAPITIAVCAFKSRNRWAVIDCALASQTLMLAAHSFGLGSCFVGGFDEKKVMKLLNIPADVKVIGLITLGYPKRKVKTPSRLNVGDIVAYNKFKRQMRNPLKSGMISFVTKQFQKK